MVNLYIVADVMVTDKENMLKIKSFVEKPKTENAPSHLKITNKTGSVNKSSKINVADENVVLYKQVKHSFMS